MISAFCEEKRKDPHLESKNTRTPVPQQESYQAYGSVHTRRLDLSGVSSCYTYAEGHLPPFEWPLTSHRLVSTDGPFQPTAATHREIAITAASTSANPHVSNLRQYQP